RSVGPPVSRPPPPIVPLTLPSRGPRFSSESMPPDVASDVPRIGRYNDLVTSNDEPLRVVDRRWWARNQDNADAPAEERVDRKPTVVEELEQQLADKTAQLQSVLAEHRRALEEFEQIKTRMRREVGREVERGKRAVVADLLEVLD